MTCFNRKNFRSSVTTAFTSMSRFVYLFPISFPYWICWQSKRKTKVRRQTMENHSKKTTWMGLFLCCQRLKCQLWLHLIQQPTSETEFPTKKRISFPSTYQVESTKSLCDKYKEISDEHLSTRTTSSLVLNKRKTTLTFLPFALNFYNIVKKCRETSEGKNTTRTTSPEREIVKQSLTLSYFLSVGSLK